MCMSPEKAPVASKPHSRTRSKHKLPPLSDGTAQKAGSERRSEGDCGTCQKGLRNGYQKIRALRCSHMRTSVGICPMWPSQTTDTIFIEPVIQMTVKTRQQVREGQILLLLSFLPLKQELKDWQERIDTSFTLSASRVVHTLAGLVHLTLNSGCSSVNLN